MATVTSTLAVAAAEIGTVGGTKYRGPGSAPWCASFVSWVLATAGVEPRYSSAATGAFVTWAQGAGRWKTSGPRPGDLVLFRFPGAIRTSSTPPVNHIGFVQAVNADGSLTTIEGNTSMGNNVNGNGVARRSRPTTYVQGYVAMTYDDAPTTTPTDPGSSPTTPITSPEEDDMLIYDGSGFWLLSGGKLLPIGDTATVGALRAAGVKDVSITLGDRDRWLGTHGSAALIVRCTTPTRGVALLAGAGGWTGLGSEADAVALTRAGVPTVTVSDATFTALSV